YDAWERAIEQGGLEGRKLAIDEAIFSNLYNKLQKTNIAEMQNQIAQIQAQITKLNESKNVIHGVSDSIDNLSDSTNVLKNEIQSLIPFFNKEGDLLGFVSSEVELLSRGFRVLSKESETLEEGTEQLIGITVEFIDLLEEQVKKNEELSKSIDFLADVY